MKRLCALLWLACCSTDSAIENGAESLDAGPDVEAHVQDAAPRHEVPEPPDPGPDASSLVALDVESSPALACDPMTGIRQPLRSCTSEDPCVRPARDVKAAEIDDPSPPPTCSHPALALLDFEVGPTRRYACVARPSASSSGSLRPLVLYFHPGGAVGADTLPLATQLLERYEDFVWDDEDTGFFVAALHGRSLHYPTLADRDGLHFDFLYRDLGSPTTNPDLAAVDALVNRLLVEGVDPKRIFAMGWSNGGFFAQQVAIARHDPTDAGYRVAAAAVFATADPFAGVQRDPLTDEVLPVPACALADVPTSRVPIQLVYRACDYAVPCNATQAACFDGEPGYDTTAWLERAAGVLDVTPVLIAGFDGPAVNYNEDTGSCTDLAAGCPALPTSACTPTSDNLACRCFYNHLLWPDGVTDQGGVTIGPDRERGMLEFLKAHPLP